MWYWLRVPVLLLVIIVIINRSACSANAIVLFLKLSCGSVASVTRRWQ